MELAEATVVVRAKDLLVHVRARRQFDVVQLSCLNILDSRLDRSIGRARQLTNHHVLEHARSDAKRLVHFQGVLVIRSSVDDAARSFSPSRVTYMLLFDATYAACLVYHIATFTVMQQISNCASCTSLREILMVIGRFERHARPT